MKTITKEEFDQLPLKANFRTHNSEIYQRIRQLDVNEALLLEKDEWKGKGKHPISANVMATFRRQRSKRRYITRMLSEDKGWVILRVE